jgi:membrane protease YdiL (CAAX protease family)
MDRPLRIYLWLAFGITWGVGGVALLAGDIRSGGATPLHPLHYVAAFGPTVAGLLMAARVDGRDGLRRLLVRALPRTSSLLWYVAVVVGFPAVNLIATWLIAPASLATLPSWGRLLYMFPVTIVTDTGPLGEEFGWRGFALPRLLDRQHPLLAAVILGAIWWAWHLPTFFVPALSQSRLSVPVFLVNSLALSIIMTWLYRRTSGDLLLMILMHAAANYCGAIGIPFNVEVLVELACAGLIVGSGGLRSNAVRNASPVAEPA